MVLKQRQGFRTKEFELLGSELRVKTKGPEGRQEWAVSVEHLGESRFYNSGSKKGGYLTAGFFLLFILVTNVGYFLSDGGENIWLVISCDVFFGALAGFLIFTPPKSEVHLTGGSTTITFFSNSPSKQEVEFFIDEVISRTKHLLISKYGKVDPDLPEDTQMNQLNWLKNRDILSESEYEELKQEYKIRKLVK